MTMIATAAVFAACLSSASAPEDVRREALAQEIAARVGERTAFADGLRTKALASSPDRSLVRTESWQEVWPATEADVRKRKGASLVTNDVTAEVWSDAIDAALKARGAVSIPPRKEPYYIDRPIVLGPGQAIVATGAEIRLKPKTSTCLLRNRTVVGMDKNLNVPDVPYDRGILVEGGTWFALKTASAAMNGNRTGGCGTKGGVRGCHGALLFNHVDGLVVRNVTVGGCQAHAIQLSDVHGFRLDGITLRAPTRDGVHVHGGSDWGWIGGVSGATWDDFVAINAWDWMHTAPVVGPIHHVLVEDVLAGPNGTRDLRLLPGNRRRPDGSGTVSCEISDVVLRRLKDIASIKAYDQPNLELGRNRDRSEPIGTLTRIFVNDIRLTRPCRIEIDENVNGFDVSKVNYAARPSANEWLTRVGPMSRKYGKGVELFSPEADITVRDLGDNSSSTASSSNQESHGLAYLPCASALVRVMQGSSPIAEKVLNICQMAPVRYLPEKMTGSSDFKLILYPATGTIKSLN